MVYMSVTVSPALRVERSRDLRDIGPQSFKHRPDHTIAANAQAIGENLRRQMAVAELPGKGEEMMTVPPAHFVQGFGRGDNLDHPSVVEQNSFPVTQQAGTGKIEQKDNTSVRCHLHPAAMARGLIERDPVRRIVSMGKDGVSAQHGQNRK